MDQPFYKRSEVVTSLVRDAAPNFPLTVQKKTQSLVQQCLHTALNCIRSFRSRNCAALFGFCGACQQICHFEDK